MPCGKPALVVRAAQSRYELSADNVMRLDGTTPKRGDPVVCGSCKQPLHPQWLFASPEREAITV